MAKALLGYLNHDAAQASALASENRRLRARISDLETVVVRLAEENDHLAAQIAASDLVTAEHEMQPA